MQKLLIICGPTAAGKTQLAFDLAKKFDGELISADSRQVYRGVDIGTGKDMSKNFKFPACAEDSVGRQISINFRNKNFQLMPYNINGIPLWLYDVVNPDEEFSVAHYQKLATYVVEDIQKRGKLPIIVGGTGLYIESLVSPIETSHIPPNKNLRKVLQALDIRELQKRLKNEDMSVWDKMNASDRQNPRRLMRKIEMTEYYSRHPDPDVSSEEESHPSKRKLDNLDVFLIGLTATNPILYQCIDKRVEKRFHEGIIQEIKTLLSRGYSWDLASMNTFGYKEWKLAFQKMENGKEKKKKNSKLIKDIIQRWKWDEHGYARRQMAWFKKMSGIRWVDITKDNWQEKVETEVRTWYN
jgi:tRNA dimethylallyltransferase